MLSFFQRDVLDENLDLIESVSGGGGGGGGSYLLLVYKFRKIIRKMIFPYHFKKIIVLYKRLVIYVLQ